MKFCFQNELYLIPSVISRKGKHLLPRKAKDVFSIAKGILHGCQTTGDRPRDIANYLDKPVNEDQKSRTFHTPL